MSEAQVRTTASGREYVRTPDDRFASLPGFPYAPHYTEVDGLRVHYVDEGPRDGDVVLLLHGQPDWSYLYRKMIPVLVAAGYRAIAPDMIGMGRSDKPIDIHTHTVEQHVAWLDELMRTLGLQDVTLFCQDWGGMIGLRVIAEHPERFQAVCAANTALMRMPEPLLNLTQGLDREAFPIDEQASVRTFQEFVGSVAHLIGPDMSAFFEAWMRFALWSPGLEPSQNIALDFGGIELSPGEAAAYDAPFPGPVYRTGVRTLPSMASLADEAKERAAWERIQTFDKPFLTVFGERDLLVGSKKIQDRLIECIPGARGQAHARIAAGHFLQESAGEEVAERLVAFMQSHR